MIDMGKYKGKTQLYLTQKSFAEMIRDGEICAIPDQIEGIIFKRAERCTELEKKASFTLDELLAIKAKQENEENHNGS